MTDGPITTELAKLLLGRDDAIAGEARYGMCGAGAVKGIERIMFGGILIDCKGSDQWEAFDGSVIFVPRRELIVPRWGYRLDQLVTSMSEMEPK